MPKIEFLASELGPGSVVDRPDGGRMIDACDEAAAPVEFSCRSASCGTCRVDVLEGAALLAPPREDELEVLEIFESAPTHRLACQAVIRPGSGLIQLRWVND